MKEVMKKALDHPIASIFIISELSCGIARIVRACKGTPVTPVVVATETTAAE